ncbi:hypothetical protein R3P38DRAFT_3155607 [Favolaschia claudopus]|uniref:F-box domain-containing protein n=1 Tax=Favolaschia claudopus TaxID=2862362 RepID=A0AAV9YYL0_9AGAR
MSGQRSSSKFLPTSAETQQIYSLLRSHAPPPSHIASDPIARSLSDELERRAQDIAQLRDSEELAKAEEDHAILAKHCSNVRSLLSPIRRLPSELLVDVFVAYAALHDSEEEQFMEDRAEWMEHRAQRALEALAQKPLLVLSRVCSRWYGLVMNTPTLWSTIELDVPERWTQMKSVSNAMLLLNRALERSADAPLTIEVFTLEGGVRPRILKLLGQHSHRWRNFSLYCSVNDLRHLRNIKGNLPLLETLTIDLAGDGFDFDRDAKAASRSVELFTEVPRLRSLTMGMLHDTTLAQVHLDKVKTLRFVSPDAQYAPTAVAFMAMVPARVKFQLLLFISNWADHNITPGINAPATSSYIEAFAIGMHDYFEAGHCVKALTDILDALTLPQLLHLEFRSEDAPNSLLSWTHTPFLNLATRSSFQTHLQSLCMSDVVITEPQLLQVLSVLPLLQTLAISDHVTTEEGQHGADQLLLTDSLLAALTLDAGAQSRPLVPLLCDFEFRSTLQFKDDVFDVFLSSRCQDSSTSCVARLYWIQDHGRALDPSVVTRIRDLCIRKRLSWEFCATE